MTPTVLLLIAAAMAVVRSRPVPGLLSAARALCALLLLDMYHHTCQPLLDARCGGASLSVAEVWALRLDGAIVAGGWCAVVAWMLACVPRPRPDQTQRRWFATSLGGAFFIYGIAAVTVSRRWPEAWSTLLVAPRFVVGALAWWASRNTNGPPREVERAAGATRFRGCCGRSRSVQGSASLLIGQIIAACQVAAAAFLWSRWGDVRLLSSACWLACAWVAWWS